MINRQIKERGRKIRYCSCKNPKIIKVGAKKKEYCKECNKKYRKWLEFGFSQSFLISPIYIDKPKEELMKYTEISIKDIFNDVSKRNK